MNIGWLEKIRQEKPSQVVGQHIDSNGKVIADKITIGKDGAFPQSGCRGNGCRTEKIAVQYQDDTELVVICGRQLLADKYFPIVNKDQPTPKRWPLI